MKFPLRHRHCTMLLQAWSVLAVMGVVHTASPSRREWCEGGNCGLGVYGGDYTKYQEFPFIVAIFEIHEDGYEYTCGGSVLSGHTVLTAAHCYDHEGKTGYVVRGGHEWYGDRNVIEIKVVAFTTHEKYNDSANDKKDVLQYDIAIIKLKKNILVASGGVVQRVKIHNRLSEDITSAKVCGWGATSEWSEDVNPVLQCISIKFDNRICAPDSSFLCAGNHSEFASSVKTVLQGDSGSPVIVGERYQVAIAVAIQGGKPLPGWSAFLKVSNHYDWIVKQMKVRPDIEDLYRDSQDTSEEYSDDASEYSYEE